MKTSSLRTLVYLAGGLGLLVSIFAAAEFYVASLQSVCTINSFFSCATVSRSGHTETFGIPDYLWGIGGFVAILLVAGFAERRAEDRRLALGLVALTSAGVGFTIYFLYVQLAIIHAFCVVCATADLFGWIAWVGAIVLALRTGTSPSRASAAQEPPPEEPEAA